MLQKLVRLFSSRFSALHKGLRFIACSVYLFHSWQPLVEKMGAVEQVARPSAPSRRICLGFSAQGISFSGRRPSAANPTRARDALTTRVSARRRRRVQGIRHRQQSTDSSSPQPRSPIFFFLFFISSPQQTSHFFFFASVAAAAG